jgi:CBS domain containing-hemolysin-like protein/mannitol/fructose-specific phosphotransferase system IIA component (Ntr-type)
MRPGLMTLDLAILFIALLALLATNAFFVLAEFAIVKVRPSRVAQLSAEGDARARLLATIQDQLDQYLSVCQVGITLASVALGMVGERTAEIIMGESHSTLRHVLAIAVSYLVISGSHILLGELVPKSIAIRVADRAAILCARPLRVLHGVFFPALWLLTAGSNAILRLLRIQRTADDEQPSEKELRIILDQSQERGLMSFRRLLFMENIFDLGGLQVKDAMRLKTRVRTLDASLPWADNLRIIQESRFSRFPLLTSDPKGPTGFVHVKDLLMRSAGDNPNLEALARPLLATTESTPLETLFAEMQRRRVHVALVADTHGQWTGLITLEDILEELVGTIHDEFDKQEPVRLSEILSADHIHLGIEAASTVDAVFAAVHRMPSGSVPVPVTHALRTRSGRERVAGTYLSDGIGMPHARLLGLDKPFVMFLRSNQGVPCDGTSEKARLLFVLLTPAGQPRIHQQLQGIIATLLHESAFVVERLRTATSAEEVLEVIRTGEQAVLD